jgi:membrane-bound serine protease (ClpP class)
MTLRGERTRLSEARVLFVVAILLLIFAPSPWGLVGALVAGGLGVLEIAYYQRRVSRMRVRTGEEALVGATGVAVDRLAPSGQIRVGGELWEARAATEVPPGASVRVKAVHGLELDVEPIESASS